MRPLAVLILVVGALAALLYALTSISGADRGSSRSENIVGPATPTEANGPRSTADLNPVTVPVPIPDRAPERVVAEAGEGGAQPRGAFGGGIEGIVVDADDFPVAGAKVSLVAKRPGTFSETIQLMHNKPPPRPFKELTTQPDGTFSFINLDPNKPWTIVVTHEDYSRSEEGPIPVPENSIRRETIRLERGLSSEGYVIDADTQLPIAGAKLVVDNPLAAFIPAARRNSSMRLEAETDNQGYFVFRNVDRGQKTLVISADAFATQVHNNFQMLVLTDPQKRVKNNRVQRKEWKSNDQTFELQRGLAIGGRVLAPDHTGIEGVAVAALSQTGAVGSRGEAVTVAGGEFLIEGVSEGLYNITVTAEGYQATPKPRIEAGDLNVEIVLAKQGSVRGRVVLPDSKPLTRAFTIKIRSIHPGNKLPGAPLNQQTFRSPKGGQFEVSSIPEGNYVAEALATGFASSFSDPFQVTQGIPTDEVEIRMSAGGRLTGQVVDSYTGEPIAGAEVSTNDNNWMDNDIFQLFGSLSSSSLSKSKATTDGQGRFSFKLMTPGEYQIEIKRKDFTSLVFNDVVIRADEKTDLGTKAMNKGAVIVGVVYGPDGSAEAGAMVQLSPLDSAKLWSGQRTRTDAEGNFTLRNAQAGTYKLYAQKRAKPQSSPWDGIADMRNSEITVTIADGGEYQYNLNLGR